MKIIDGSQGEGGGQVLRTVLALSLITGEPVTIQNIRARRRTPGLAPQHLAGVRAAASLCNAEVTGDQIKSPTLSFVPSHPVVTGDYTFDISKLSGQSSAGAITLLLQALLIPLAMGKGDSSLLLSGGTHVSWSPPFHYFQWVLLPALQKMGIQAEADLLNWGWYPQGGGQVLVRIRGDARITGIDCTERGRLLEIKGIAAASNLPSHIPQRISDRVNNLLDIAGLPATISPLRTGGPSTGAGVFLAAVYESSCAGFSRLGKKGVASEKVADSAALDLIDFHKQKQAVDRYLPDQLVLAAALANTSSTFTTVEITNHTLTTLNLLQQFLGRDIQAEGQKGAAGIIRIV